MFQVDAKTLIQLLSTVLTLLIIPAIKFFVGREVKRFETALAENRGKTEKLESDVNGKIEKLGSTVNDKIEKLKEEFDDLKSDMPFIYVTREDFIRAMDNVDRSIGNLGQKMDRLFEHVTKKGEC